MKCFAQATQKILIYFDKYLVLLLALMF